MSKTIKFNHEILNEEYGWSICDNPLDAMFINDLGELLTGEWSEYHDRCSVHSEYYQDAEQDENVEYVEPIIFEPESNTFIIPDRETSRDEDQAMLEIAEAIDENFLECYFEGDNEFVGAMQALIDSGVTVETCISLFSYGDIIFIDEEQCDEYDEDDIFYTNDDQMFVLVD